MSLRAYVRAHRFAVALASIAGAGLVLRIVYAVATRHDVVGGDGNRYHSGALFLARGQGFVNQLALVVAGVRVPDTGHPPGWTVVLAGVTKLGLSTWLEHQVVTCVVGTATVVMTGLATRAVFGRARIGLIAAAIAAFYPFVWLYEREVVSEPFAMLLIAAMIWLVYAFRAAPSFGRALAIGGLLGALLMVESELITVAILLIVPLILARRDVDLRRRVGWLASAAAVCVVIMAPWSVYLSVRFDRVVLLTGSIGGSMAAGNCPQTYHGELLGYYANECVFGGGKNTAGDPIGNDARLRRKAVDFIRAHESRAPVVMAARVARTFGFFRPFQQMRLETERGTKEWVFGAGFFAYWALLPFAVAGVVLARRRKIPVYPLLVFVVVVVLSVFLAIGAVRYRAPFEIPLVMLAAVGLDALIRTLPRRSKRREAPALFMG